MTHTTDCTVLDEFREYLDDIAQRIYNSGGRRMRGEIREEIEEEIGWNFLGSGAARAAFRVSHEFQEGPKNTPTRAAPCVVKFATPGRNIGDGREQNREEIHNFNTLPSDLVGRDDPAGSMPAFVPLSDWDNDEFLWISLPEVDGDGGSPRSVKDRLMAEGWRCGDIHIGNVGSIHGSSIIMDYGVDCESISAPADIADEIGDMLETFGCRGVSVNKRESSLAAQVEFLPPLGMPGDEPVKTSSTVTISGDVGRAGVERMELVFGTWSGDYDPGVLRSGANAVRRGVDNRTIRDVDVNLRRYKQNDGDPDFEVIFDVDTFNRTDSSAAMKLYSDFVETVEGQMPTGGAEGGGVPDSDKRIEDIRREIDKRNVAASPNAGIHPNLAGIVEGDIIDHPEWANPITVLEIDAADGVVVISDSNDNVFDMTMSDFEVTGYDWAEHIVGHEETGDLTVGDLSVGDVVRIRHGDEVKYGVVDGFREESGRRAASIGLDPSRDFKAGLVPVGPAAEAHNWDTELLEHLGPRLTHDDLQFDDRLDHPDIGEVVILNADAPDFIGSERPADGAEFNLARNEFQPLGEKMLVQQVSIDDVGPGFDPDNLSRSLVMNMLSGESHTIDFGIPKVPGGAIARAYELGQGGVVYKELQDYTADPKVQGVDRVVDNARHLDVRLHAADIEEGMVLNHPGIHGRIEVTEVSSGGGLIRAEAIDGETFDLSAVEYQPLTAGMVVEGGAVGGDATAGVSVPSGEGIRHVQPGDISPSDVGRILDEKTKVIWFGIPENYSGVGIGTAIADVEGDVVYKTDEGEEFWTNTQVVSDNSLAVVRRLLPGDLRPGMLLDHPQEDGRLKIVEIDGDGNIIAETLDGEQFNLRLHRWQPLTANMLVEGEQAQSQPQSQPQGQGAVPTGEPDLIEVVRLSPSRGWEVLVNGEVADANNRDHEEALRRAHGRWEPGEDILKVEMPDGREVRFDPDGDVDQQKGQFSELLHPEGQPGRVEVVKNFDGDWVVFDDAIKHAEFGKWADAVNEARALRDPDRDELIVGMPDSQSPARMPPGEDFNLVADDP